MELAYATHVLLLSVENIMLRLTPHCDSLAAQAWLSVGGIEVVLVWEQLPCEAQKLAYSVQWQFEAALVVLCPVHVEPWRSVVVVHWGCRQLHWDQHKLPCKCREFINFHWIFHHPFLNTITSILNTVNETYMTVSSTSWGVPVVGCAICRPAITSNRYENYL